MINDGYCVGGHADQYAIIGSQSQLESSDNRDCDIRKRVSYSGMTDRPALRPEVSEVFDRLRELHLSQNDLAAILKLEPNKISKVKSGERQFKGPELLKALNWLEDMAERQSFLEPDYGPHPIEPVGSYVEVEVLPTYAGMGGGGTGEGDRAVALVSRALIVDELKGNPSDFILIDVRGDSMEPDFHHGDQILIDRRDTSTAQPGPFALWDGEWGEYVVKNVERVTGGQVRIFSSNQKYTAAMVESEQTRIIGRPVWFGRRL